MAHLTSLASRHGRAPTVGFLVDWLENSYQWSILRGALDAARDRGANLLCFTGGILGAPAREGPSREAVFELVGPESVDALVILSGTVGNHVGAERLRAYCERYRPLPMCSVALDLDGIASVCVDNEVGMRRVLGHLVHHHGMKRIAFVRGPEMNPEADRRFAVYQEVLAEAGLALDPRLIAPGDFQPDAGRRAVELFFEERRLAVDGVDAIACANDSMALGVLEALDARGVRVPDRIALVGFDDVEEVRFTTPPLTTVRQPLHRQGREAVTMVLDQLRDGRHEKKLVLETELVTRRSCRCFNRRDALTSPPSSAPLSFEALFVARRQIILADLARAARGAFSAAGSGWEVRLLNALADQLRGQEGAGFVEIYDDLLRRLTQSGVDLSICHDVVAALRRHLLWCTAHDRRARPIADALLEEVGELTGNAMERVQAWQRIHTQRQARSLGRAGSTMVAAFDLGELARAVSESLPTLGIESCYVAVFEQGPGGQRQSRLVLAYDAAARGGLRHDGIVYRAEEVVPRALMSSGREYTFAVAPLLFRDEELGLLILHLGAADGHVYEALRDLFAAALSGARLLDRLGAEGRARAVAAAALAESRTRVAALLPVREVLAAVLTRFRTAGRETLDVGAIEADLERAYREIEWILAEDAADP